jgi:hypothetical protein
MDVPKEINYMNFKVQLVIFKVVPFAIYTLVPTTLPTSEAILEIIFHCSFDLWNFVKTVSFHHQFNFWE